MNMTAREAADYFKNSLELDYKFEIGTSQSIQAVKLAIAALEAQVPRVLKKQDIQPYNRPYVCLEIKGHGTEWITKSMAMFFMSTIDDCLQKCLRFWNLSPTHEQMAATPWGEGNAHNPTTEPEPSAHWQPDPLMPMGSLYYCSECGKPNDTQEAVCPHCHRPIKGITI
jgi:hypothetical protein